VLPLALSSLIHQLQRAPLRIECENDDAPRREHERRVVIQPRGDGGTRAPRVFSGLTLCAPREDAGIGATRLRWRECRCIVVCLLAAPEADVKPVRPTG
jgi:hypothetical protein